MGIYDVHSLPADDLAREGRRLRALARGLLYDHHGGEDLVQEAWLAALRDSAPRGSASLSAWLTGTVKNLVRQRHRADGRRERREAAAARPERLAATDESVGRIELLQRVLAAVQGLDEPYRTAVELRYLEDLPPREIARRTGHPVNTVRTHVRRGLERVRTEIDPGDDTGEGRGALLAALVPLAGAPPLSLGLPPVGSASTSHLGQWTGALLMSNKLVATALVALLVAFAFLTDPVGLLGSEPAQPAVAAQPAELELDSPAVAADVDVEHEAEQPRRTVAPSAASTGTGDWVVRGVAADQAGEPLPGFDVTGRLHAGYDENAPVIREARLTTGADGRFAWRLAAPERSVTVAVDAADDGVLAYGSEQLVIHGDAAPESLRVRVYPLDVDLTGRVVDIGGDPIAGALVESLGFETTTDADGRYALRSTSERSHTRIRAQADGYAKSETNVTPVEPGPLSSPDIVLANELVVRGRVVDEDGGAIEGATVFPSFREDLGVVTDERGRFELGTFEADADRIYTHVECDGYARLQQGHDVAKLSDTLELVLTRAGELAGRVVDADGQPLEAALVTVVNPPDTIPRCEAYSGADGAFLVRGIEPGRHPAWISRAGFAAVKTEVEVPPPGAGPGRLDVTLTRGLELGGVVLGTGDEPQAGVLVYVERATRWGDGDGSLPATRTDEDGRFHFASLPDVALQLGFLQDGYSRLVVDDLELGLVDHVVRLERGGQLAGRVIDGTTGEPVQSFTVRFVDPLLEEGEERLWGYWIGWFDGVAFVDTDGYWRCDEEDFDAGKVTGIEILADGYAPTVLPRAITVTDAEDDELVFRMFQGSRVAGRVVELASGAPVEGARVVRVPTRLSPSEAAEGRRQALETTTDSRGHFELTGVPGEPMSIAVYHDDWMTAVDGPFDVAPQGDDLWRDISVRAGAALDVRLLSADGEPLAGEPVLLSQLAEGLGHDDDARTDADGRALFEHLPEGRYQVSWGRSNADESSTVYLLSSTVSLGADERATLELRPRGSCTVTGTVAMADGSAPPDDLVVFLNPRGEFASENDRPASRADFATNGQFTIEHVQPGSYAVTSYHYPRDGNGHWRGHVLVEVTGDDRVTAHVILERAE
jgi:RNA polymerase sigma-70 factor (ECF subfamily)